MRIRDRALRRLLDECGVPHRLEHGRRHLLLYVGDTLVGALPRSHVRTSGRSGLNFIAAVRRAIREESERGLKR